MYPREEKLPAWARDLIADLRKLVETGREPLVKELASLRPQNELLKAKEGALMELLECAARGGHLGAASIVRVLSGYSLQLVKDA